MRKRVPASLLSLCLLLMLVQTPVLASGGREEIREQPVVSVTVDQGSLRQVYSGTPRTVKVTAIPADAAVTVTYDNRKDPPVDAGTYTVNITAQAVGYSTAAAAADMIIEPAAPQVKKEVAAAAIAEGEKLGTSKLTGTFGDLRGAVLRGTLAWDDGSVTAAAGTAYGWTFTPDSSNYSAVKGTASPAVSREDLPGDPSGADGPPAGSVPSPVLTPAAEADLNGTAEAYVREAAMGEAVQEARETGAGSIVIVPAVEGTADSIFVHIPAVSAAAAAEAGLFLRVETSAADILISPAGLAGLKEDALSSVTFSASSSEDGTVTIGAAADGEAAETVEGGLKVSIPSASGNTLFLVNPDGSETAVRKSVADGEGLSALLKGSCTVRAEERKADFTDVDPSSWYDGAVDFVFSRGLFSGTSEDTFSPFTEMNRSMLAAVLHRLEGEVKTDSTAVFTDVEEGAWYCDGIRWASARGIILGKDDGSFGVDDPVTRQDMIVMMYRYARSLGLDTASSGDLSIFQDSGSIADYAREAVSWACDAGLIYGADGVLNPLGSAARVEVAVLMERLTELIVNS